MNTIEEDRITRGIERVLESFGIDERPAVRVWLCKQVYGIRWRAIGRMFDLDTGTAVRIGFHGRCLLERAKARRLLDRETMAERLKPAPP